MEQTEINPLADIPPGQVLFVVPPRFDGLMSGVKTIRITATADATLFYTDDTDETANIGLEPDAEIPGFLALVGAVQSRRIGGDEDGN